MMHLKWKGIFLLLMMWSLCGEAQRVEVSVNRNNILIGEQVEYGLKVIVPTAGYKVHFLLPDSVPHFEILKKQPVTEITSPTPAVEQVITFTSFDSGSWVFPAVPVKLIRNNRQIELQSSTVLIQVGYSPQDTTGLYDIRGVHKMPIPDNFWYYVIAAIILALLLAWLIYRYFRNKKNKPAPLFHSGDSPLEEAIAALHKLKANMPPAKELHTEAVDIGKHYLSRKWQKDVSRFTSGDVLMEFSNDSRESVTRLAALLRLSDAVKFAKFVPGRTEDKEALDEWEGILKKLDEENRMNP